VALKLKEISYIHAEASASVELKHGPLALIDDEMPVIVVAPNNELLEKLKSNVEEVRARGGIMYVFADKNATFSSDETLRCDHCSKLRITYRTDCIHYPTATIVILRSSDQGN